MKWDSFDGWKDEGYYVNKGEHSTLRDPITGEFLFNEEQVTFDFDDYDRYDCVDDIY